MSSHGEMRGHGAQLSRPARQLLLSLAGYHINRCSRKDHGQCPDSQKHSERLKGFGAVMVNDLQQVFLVVLIIAPGIVEMAICLRGIGMASPAKHFLEGDEGPASDLDEKKEGQNGAKGSVILPKGFFSHACSSAVWFFGGGKSAPLFAVAKKWGLRWVNRCERRMWGWDEENSGMSGKRFVIYDYTNKAISGLPGLSMI